MNYIEAPDGDLINLERCTLLSHPKPYGDNESFAVWSDDILIYVGPEADCQRFWEQIKQRTSISTPPSFQDFLVAFEKGVFK